MNTQPKYTKTQIIHSLSFASNSAFGLTFESNKCQESYNQLQDFVTETSKKLLADKKIKTLIGDDWDTVWGPVVYSHDKNSSFARADNTMGVYYSKSQNLFVIAIAGTNSISSFAWLKEDFDVRETKKWKDITGKGYGYISKGAATGLNVLTNIMTYENQNILEGLKNYISIKDISKAEVAVAGHSLGGALSPALALYLSDKKTSWDTTGTINISTYPTAGPTISSTRGEWSKSKFKFQQFYKYYTEQIDAGNISYNSQINNLDIVPLAWNKDDLSKIPSIYKKNGVYSETIGTLSLTAFLNKGVYNYNQIQPIQILKGDFNDEIEEKGLLSLLKVIGKSKDILIPKPLRPYFKDLKNLILFLAQASYQHTTAYNSLLEIESFIEQLNNVINSLKPKSIKKDTIVEDISTKLGFDLNALIDFSDQKNIEKLKEEELIEN